MSVDAILKESEGLSDEERTVFLDQLAGRYPEPDPIPEVSPEMEQELNRRVAEADANPDAGIPWDVVYAESMKRVRK